MSIKEIIDVVQDLEKIYSKYENPKYPASSDIQFELMNEFNSYFSKKGIDLLKWEEAYDDNEIICKIIEPHTYIYNGIKTEGTKCIMSLYIGEDGITYFDDGTSPTVLIDKTIKEIAKEFIKYLRYANFK